MTPIVAVWAPVAREPILGALNSDAKLTIRVATTETEFLAALDGAEIAVVPGIPTFYTPAVAAAIRASASIKWVHLISAGHEGAEATGWANGVLFSHPGGAVSGAVAEHAIGLLLALSRQLPVAMTAQATGKWERTQAPRTTTLAGGTLAVVGFGSIGERIGRIARGFDAHVIGVSRSGRANAAADEIAVVEALPDVVARADFIVAALPLTTSTRRLFDAALFDRCRPGVRFVNVGRGGSVDQAALIAALASGKLGGAALDVTEPEPLPADDPLWQAPNLLLTAHYAGAGDRRSGRLIAEGLTRNLALYRSGAPLEHQIAW